MRLTHTPSQAPADYSFAHDIRVRFCETDAMGIVHHAAYLPYLEEARVAWMRERGHPYERLRSEGFDAAVLEVFMQYLRPSRFDEIVAVRLQVVETTRTTFQVAYLLTVGDEVRATGVTVHGCVDANGRPVRLPAWLRDLATDA